MDGRAWGLGLGAWWLGVGWMTIDDLRGLDVSKPWNVMMGDICFFFFFFYSRFIAIES